MSRVLDGALGRLEPDEGKLSSPVLRGGSGRKAAPLPDTRATNGSDTGPLVALVDADDSAHASCLAALPRMTRPLLTIWPCFTEAMYLVGSAGGYPAQDELWGYLEDGLVQIHQPDVAEYRRMRVLMRQYRDTPMDLGDASLVVAAEVLNVTRIFTIDSDFRVYRIHRKTPFEIIP